MPGIDIHTHAFHPKIASKAVRALEKTYGVHCLGSGLLPDLEEEEVRAGVSYFAVLCAATAPSQVLPANNFTPSKFTKTRETGPLPSVRCTPAMNTGRKSSIVSKRTAYGVLNSTLTFRASP